MQGEDGRVTRHLAIAGRVQGVGYRISMARAARALGITGWVRNRLDGSVEAMVQGAPEAVDELLAWAARGPDAARVDRVDAAPGEGDFAQFAVRETA